jgi:glycosyltransferase involved in cell wall biosynthesis
MEALENDTRHAAFVIEAARDFDIVHVHSPYAVLLAAALADLPVVHTDHGWHSSHSLFELVGSRADFVAPSRAYCRELPRLPHLHVVHHGIDVGRYPFLQAKENYAVFIGRMVRAKGLHLAIGTARAAGIPLKAVSVSLGFEEEERYYDEDIRPLMGDDVELVRTEVGFDRKVELLSRARALLFPIDWREPFGLIVAEAMACGTPVIATRCAATTELICERESGFVVDVQDYVSVGSRLLRDDVTSLVPARCRRWAERRFGAERMVRAYEAVYEQAKLRATSKTERR